MFEKKTLRAKRYKEHCTERFNASTNGSICANGSRWEVATFKFTVNLKVFAYGRAIKCGMAGITMLD